MMVTAFGASVLLARDGAEAIETVARSSPDLVLCDLNMPRADGYQFMEWLRGQPAHRRTPVIALTALGMASDFDRTWEAGFSGHLVKPVDLDIIEAQLRRVFPSRSR